MAYLLQSRSKPDISNKNAAGGVSSFLSSLKDCKGSHVIDMNSNQSTNDKEIIIEEEEEEDPDDNMDAATLMRVSRDVKGEWLDNMAEDIGSESDDGVDVNDLKSFMKEEDDNEDMPPSDDEQNEEEDDAEEEEEEEEVDDKGSSDDMDDVDSSNAKDNTIADDDEGDEDAKKPVTTKDTPAVTTKKDNVNAAVGQISSVVSEWNPSLSVYIGNISFDSKKDDVETAIHKALKKSVDKIRLETNSTGKLKGFGYMQLKIEGEKSKLLSGKIKVVVGDRELRFGEFNAEQLSQSLLRRIKKKKDVFKKSNKIAKDEGGSNKRKREGDGEDRDGKRREKDGSSRPPLECFNCHGIGHISRECPKERDNKSVKKVFNANRHAINSNKGEGGNKKCYNCGGSGHISSSCSQPKRNRESKK